MKSLSRTAAASLLFSLAALRPPVGRAIMNGAPPDRDGTIARATVAVVNFSRADHGCSGVLIAPDWVVTAAHCVTADFETLSGTPRPWQVRVLFGNSPPVRNDPLSISVRNSVPKVFLHPEFAGRKGIYGPQRHDVALLHLPRNAPAPFSPAPFLHAAVPDLAVGQETVVAGYGSDAPNSDGSGFTLRAFTTVVSQFLPGSSIVEARPAPGRPGGNCDGDSGGPAFIADGDALVLWGVSSAGSARDGAADCATFAQYEDLRSYRSWILSVMGGPAGD